MNTRFICPHCHFSLDPLSLEIARSAGAQYRICPECDGPVVLFSSAVAGEARLRAPAGGGAGDGLRLERKAA
jgi:hypothetical protein